MIDPQTNSKCLFDLAPESRQEVLTLLRQWLGEKLPSAARSAFEIDTRNLNIPTNSSLVFAHHLLDIAVETGSGSTSSPEFWSIRYEHSDSAWQNRRWRTDVSLQFTGQLRFCSRVSHFIEGDWFGPEPQSPAHSIPRFATQLVTKKLAMRDSRVLSLRSTEVTDLHAFVDFLTSPNRTLPIVLISKNKLGQYLLTDVAKFARRVGSNAHIFHLPSADDAYFLSDTLGDDFSTFGGAVRVYQAPFDPVTDHPTRHRFFPPSMFRERGALEIEESLVRGLLRSAMTEGDELSSSIEDVRQRSSEQLAQFALGDDVQLRRLKSEIEALRKTLDVEVRNTSDMLLRLQASEENAATLAGELTKAAIPVPQILAPKTLQNFELLRKRFDAKVICIANSTATPKFPRILSEDLRLSSEEVSELFEVFSLEQTSNQISNMVKKFSDKVVIYAWYGLKDATEVNDKFVKLFQAQDVRRAIGRFKEWALPADNT